MRASIVFGLLISVLAPTQSRATNLKPEQVPTFSYRGRVLTVGGNAPDGKMFSLQCDVQPERVPLSGSDWSEWRPYTLKDAEATLKGYPAIYQPLWPVVVRLVYTGLEDPSKVEAEIKLDETGEVIPCNGELFGSQLGIILWRDEQNKPHAQHMAAYNQRYWKAIGLDPKVDQPRPKLFPIVDRFIAGDDDRRDWLDGITQLNRAGFSGIMLPPDKRLREMLLSVGQRRTAWAIYNPPGYAFDHEGITDDSIAKWAKEQVDPYKAAGYEPRDMSIFAMSDEPGWYYPMQFKSLLNSPPALARFREYVAKQGLLPADVGAAAWDQVLPIGRSAATDLPHKRLFYWTMRFFSWDSSRHFAKCTAALEREFYPGMPIFTNWNFFSGRFYVPGPAANCPDKTSPDAGMGGHDWFEFGRMRGCTMLWTEDWFPDSMAPQWSFYMAKLRSAARLGGVEYGGYVIPRTSGDRPDGIVQKILSVVGHGGKAVKYFVFGPEYVFPGNCYSENAEVMRGMAKAHAMIAKAEDVLWPGRPVPAEVAILAPRSACVWDDPGPVGAVPIEDATINHLNTRTVDYMAEVFNLYTALQHANIPCDFVDEDGLTAEGLKQFKVLYVTEPNVPAEGQSALVEWMKAGGTLVTVSGAASHDRYNVPCDILEKATGIISELQQRVLVPNLESLQVVAKGKPDLELQGWFDKSGFSSNARDFDENNGEFVALGARSKLSLAPPVLRDSPYSLYAKFEDGLPAVVGRNVGDGRILNFAWFPGLTYIKSSTEQTNGLPTGFSASLRYWIVAAVTHARLKRDFEVPNDSMVETLILKSDAGCVVTLLNWSGKPIEGLAITYFRRDAILPDIESVTHGSLLTYSRELGTWHISIPRLDAADIIVIRNTK